MTTHPVDLLQVTLRLLVLVVGGPAAPQRLHRQTARRRVALPVKHWAAVVNDTKYWTAGRQRYQILDCWSSTLTNTGLLVVNVTKHWASGCQRYQILDCWSSTLPNTGLLVVNVNKYWTAGRQRYQILDCWSSTLTNTGLLVINVTKYWTAGRQRYQILNCWSSTLPRTNTELLVIRVVLSKNVIGCHQSFQI